MWISLCIIDVRFGTRVPSSECTTTFAINSSLYFDTWYGEFSGNHVQSKVCSKRVASLLKRHYAQLLHHCDDGRPQAVVITDETCGSSLDRFDPLRFFNGGRIVKFGTVVKYRSR